MDRHRSSLAWDELPPTIGQNGHVMAMRMNSHDERITHLEHVERGHSERITALEAASDSAAKHHHTAQRIAETQDDPDDDQTDATTNMLAGLPWQIKVGALGLLAAYKPELVVSLLKLGL